MERWSWARRPALGLASVVVAGVALVAEPYHRWWWWDLLTHATVAALLAVWAADLEIPPQWRWPGFVGAMLGWEWVELFVRYFLSPGRQDVLADLTVNVVAFWITLVVIDWNASRGSVSAGEDVRR